MQPARSCRRFAVHVCLPVVLGAGFYLLFRSPELRVFDWIDGLGANDWIVRARILAAPAAEQLPLWVLFSLPDGLWVYALTAAMMMVWRGHEGSARVTWSAAGVVLAGSGEVGQVLAIVPGTFDSMDLFAIGAAFLCALWFNRSHRRGHV